MENKNTELNWYDEIPQFTIHTKNHADNFNQVHERLLNNTKVNKASIEELIDSMPNLKIYMSLDEIGCSQSNTIAEIIQTMSDNSILLWSGGFADQPISDVGTLKITRININRIACEYVNKVGTLWRGGYHSETGFSGWKQVATTDNIDATTLGGLTYDKFMYLQSRPIASQDWNTLTDTGIYLVLEATGDNMPPNCYTYGTLIVTNITYATTQIYYEDAGAENVWMRTGWLENGVINWKEWKNIITNKGGTLSGDITIAHENYPTVWLKRGSNQGVGLVEGGNNSVSIQVYNTDENDEKTNNRRILTVENSDRQSNIKNAIRLSDWVDGVNTIYTVYGTHNKPSANDVGALPTTGGYLTGNIGYTGGGYNGRALTFHAGDANGAGVALSAGGLTLIGGGESANAYINNYPDGGNAATENAVICADTNIIFRSGVQSGFNDNKKITITNNGEFVLNANGLTFPTSGGQWIAGKTTGNVIDCTGTSTGNYHPILRYVMNSGNVANLGAIKNQFGFWGYLSATTENRTDSGAYLNVDTGIWQCNGGMTAGNSNGNLKRTTISTGNPSGGSNGDIWIKYS